MKIASFTALLYKVLYVRVKLPAQRCKGCFTEFQVPPTFGLTTRRSRRAPNGFTGADPPSRDPVGGSRKLL
jgi:hypothetical protein